MWQGKIFRDDGTMINRVFGAVGIMYKGKAQPEQKMFFALDARK